MDRNRQVNKVVHFLLTLLIMFAVSIAPAQALLKGGTWQELNSVTGAVNGTAPLADGAIIPFTREVRCLTRAKPTILNSAPCRAILARMLPQPRCGRSIPPIPKAISLAIRPPSPGKTASRPPWAGMGRCRHARHAALAAAGSEPDLLRPKPRRATAGGPGAGGR